MYTLTTMANLWQVIPIMIFAIPITAIVCGTVVAIIKVLKGGTKRRGSELDAEDTELIQELHKGLLRMEERVEALETILVDCERDSRKGSRQ